jgi:hypothetical protein
LWVVGLLCLAANDVRGQAGAAEELEAASVRFEQNATDGDVEVVFEITGPDEGLTKLNVVAPDGRTVVDFKSPDSAQYGIREFLFESPEPKDIESLKAAYPEGKYTIDGANASGKKFHGSVSLNHQLPETTSFVFPQPRAEDVPVDNLEITWTPVEGAIGYVIELEQARLDLKVIVEQSASAARFAVPNGLLVPGMKYKLGIGTVSEGGNVSFVETSFTTAIHE